MSILEINDSNVIIGVKMLLQHKGNHKDYIDKMRHSGYNWTIQQAFSYAKEHLEQDNIDDAFNNGDIGLGAVLIADSINSIEGYKSCKVYDTEDDSKPNMKKWIKKAEINFLNANSELLLPKDLKCSAEIACAI